MTVGPSPKGGGGGAGSPPPLKSAPGCSVVLCWSAVPVRKCLRDLTSRRHFALSLHVIVALHLLRAEVLSLLSYIASYCDFCNLYVLLTVGKC